MAEGGEKTQRLLAEGEDLEEQENELLALEAIYGEKDFEVCRHDNPHGHAPVSCRENPATDDTYQEQVMKSHKTNSDSLLQHFLSLKNLSTGGTLNIPVIPPENFQVKLTKDMRLIRRLAFAAVVGRGRRERMLQRAAQKRMEDQGDQSDMLANGAKPGHEIHTDEKLYDIKRLPPISLTFAYPHDYPSVSPPEFTLSCCWLEKKNLTKLCEKLDELWEQYKGMSIIAFWHDFLSDRVIDFLGIKSPYDLGRVMVHVFTHPKDVVYSTSLRPKPFDSRGIQNFADLDDVLRQVLDSNLLTCDVCFEEKSGHEFLRLVNCDEHITCRSCLKGWIEALIKDGAVTDMKCLGYKCDRLLLPTEVKSVVSEDLYERYDQLLLQRAFDIMPDVMNCPRSFCQFPVMLEDNLGRCPKCSYAFCARCQNAYHAFTPCRLKSEMFSVLCEEYEASSNEKKRDLEMKYGKQVIQRALNETKSSKWLEINSKQCPCCGTFIQKRDGCNKMTCTSCRTFFCWLCEQELSKSNPYAHYQHPTSPCSNRLFEGVELPDDDDDLLAYLEEESDDDDDDDDDFNFNIDRV